MRRYDLLVYSPVEQSRSRVRSQYLRWRNERGIPERCDNPKCQFNSAPLVWNGKPLKLTLDHIEGNKFDNRPEMLRLLCPNCDAQLPTRGGGNRGRVQGLHKQGFRIVEKDGRTSFNYFGNGGISIAGSATVEFVPAAPATPAVPDIDATTPDTDKNR